jgi:thiol-disulfide isomerase/thioredoxin
MLKLILFQIFITFPVTLSIAQDTKIIKFNTLQKIIEDKSDTVRVINFWATWCAPCVKELPCFEKLNAKAGISVTLISLDFADKVDKVNSFLQRKNMKTKVLLLDEIDYNEWIDKIDKSWSGAIPATLIINSHTGKRKFVEKELHDGDLEKMIREVQ